MGLVQDAKDYISDGITYLEGNPIALTVVSLVIGIGLTEIVHFTKRKFNTHREVKENQNIDLSGSDWIAAWQASADDIELINTEEITIKQSGASVLMSNKEKSPENPKGGYRWRGKLDFSHGETLMGYYHPVREENLTAKGMMFFSYDASRRLFLGRWVGKAIDGVLCNGFVAIAKDRDTAIKNVNQLIRRAESHPVNVIKMDFLHTDQTDVA